VVVTLSIDYAVRIGRFSRAARVEDAAIAACGIVPTVP